MFSNLINTIIAVSGVCVCMQVAANCELVTRSADVVLMHCTQESDSELMVSAAKKECGEDERCNVWFWNSDVVLPEVAPEKDEGLPKSLTSSALAVWANDSASLLTLKKKAN